MKNFSSLISWIILLCVLAVPAFLFYNWLVSKNNAQETAAIQMKPAMDTSKMFKQETQDNIPLNSTSFSQSISPSSLNSSTRAVTSENNFGSNLSKSSETPTEVPDALSSVSDKGRESQNVKVSVSTFSTVISTMSYYAPTSKRDPILTPMDYERMREEEERAKRAMRERELEAMRKKVEDSPVKKFNLQGIIGQSAIINGEMVDVGQVFKGFKILKIGTDYVIGVYKDNKKYKLILR